MDHAQQPVRPERRAGTRFRLSLELHYVVSGSYGRGEGGSGRIIDLSRSGLRFTADRALPDGFRVEVSIDWPVMLDGNVGLQLVMAGVIVRTDGTDTSVRIHRHHFRTRRLETNAALDQESPD